MSLELDKEFSLDLNKPESLAYKKLESAINSVVSLNLWQPCRFSHLYCNVTLITHSSPTVKRPVQTNHRICQGFCESFQVKLLAFKKIEMKGLKRIVVGDDIFCSFFQTRKHNCGL